jgi:site-specific DNA-methyltransferase (adenine-specific)
MKPYYEHAGITIYHGDCREVLLALDAVDTVITDPVWPNCTPRLVGADRPQELFGEMCYALPPTKRLIVHLGCDSDPRFLSAVPTSFKFLRLCWMRYVRPTRKGRCLYGADVAHVFGEYPKSIPGRRVISGEYCSTRPDIRRMIVTKHMEWGGRTSHGEHPTPRRLQHLRWLVSKWAEGIILDPFAGSGTTLVAAAANRFPAIGIEIEEKYCEIAAKRLSQEVLEFSSGHGPNGECPHCGKTDCRCDKEHYI